MPQINVPELQVQQPTSLADQLRGVLSIKGALQQQQLQQQQLANEQQQNVGLQQQNQQRAVSLRDQQAMTAAMQEWDGQDYNTLPGIVMKKGGSAQAVMSLKEHLIEQKTKLLTLGKDQLANLKEKTALGEASAGRIIAADPKDRPNVYAQERAQLLSSGAFNPQELPEQYPGDQFVQLHATAANAAKKQIADVEEAQTKAETSLIEKDQKGRVLAGTSPTGMTAEQQSQANFRKQELAGQAAGRAETKRHDLASEGQLSPEGLDMAATQFATTGQMASVGRSAGVRAQIINRAAQLYPNIDLASNSAAFKANSESLKGLQKQKDAVTAFETTANKNLDLFIERAKKVVDSGSPWVNAPLRSVAMNALRNEDLAAFNAARQVAINEIAKVTSNPGLSGTLSDSARHEVEQFNPSNATLKQTLEVAKVLKQDMANRHQSYDEQIEAIKGRIGGGRQASAPATPAAQQGRPVYQNGKVIGYTTDGKTMTPAR